MVSFTGNQHEGQVYVPHEGNDQDYGGCVVMTDQEAQAKAVELWGPSGIAYHTTNTTPDNEWHCVVGIKLPNKWVENLGYGKTWEDAFKMASEAEA
jgi:hypothetical protein